MNEALPGGALEVEPPLFRLLVDSEMRKAQRLRYCISVICVRAKALVNEFSSPEPLLGVLRRQLRSTDVVAHWPPDALALLLIDAESGDIPVVMHRITARLEHGSWSAGGVSYPKASPVADDILRQALNLMERAIRDPGKRLYVA